MRTTDIIGIAFLAIFSLACLAAAVAFGVWWYAACAAMAALLAWAIYYEENNSTT